jgi:tellurite resistance protein TerA
MMAKAQQHPSGEQRPDASQSSANVGSGLVLPSSGTLRVNLRWRSTTADNPQAARRFSPLRWPRRTRNVDLDLGCLYQLTDGGRGVVQAVGRRDGDYARAPYIRLDRDDRVGTTTGENLFINMDQSAHFQRILIFVMIADGTNDLTRNGASVTIYPGAGPAFEIHLDRFGDVPSPARVRSCAVAQIQRRDRKIVVHRELRYFSGYQSEIDGAYDWGLRWGRGPGKSRL